MAVPKKRTSKTKTRTRRTIWKKKVDKQTNKAISTGLSVIKKGPKVISKDKKTSKLISKAYGFSKPK